MALNEQGFDNEEYLAAPQDAEYNFTLTKLDIGYITVGIQSYIDKLIANADVIQADRELTEQVLKEIADLVVLGQKLFKATDIETADDYFDSVEEELEKVKSELLEK